MVSFAVVSSKFLSDPVGWERGRWGQSSFYNYHHHHSEGHHILPKAGARRRLSTLYSLALLILTETLERHMLVLLLFYREAQLRRLKSFAQSICPSLQSRDGEGSGTPLQCSCLENPMDGGAWWAAVHGVANSWTRLSDFTFTFHFLALEKEMATHSSILAWRIPGTREPGGLLSMGSHGVGHD